MAHRRQGGARSHYGDDFSRGGNVGLSTTVEQLQALGENVLQAAKDALKRGVDDVVADAKSRCPVRSGRLRDSIKATPNADGSSYALSANATAKDGFHYGQIVEFSPKPGYRPFLYPAIEAHWREIRSNIDAAISRAVRSG